MSTKKHTHQPHLTGEHKYGDMGQLILAGIYLVIWISDSFILHYSTFLQESVPKAIRIPLAVIILLCGCFLSIAGLRQVFGTQKTTPGVITGGVFRIVRHPIYLSAILFYIGTIILTMSLISLGWWIVIIVFYYLISKYEERILTEEFGDDYREYKRMTGMLFPKLKG